MRVKRGENTCVTTHDVLSPPLRDAPPHGITPSRYSDPYHLLTTEHAGRMKHSNMKPPGRVTRSVLCDKAFPQESGGEGFPTPRHAALVKISPL